MNGWGGHIQHHLLRGLVDESELIRHRVTQWWDQYVRRPEPHPTGSRFSHILFADSIDLTSGHAAREKLLPMSSVPRLRALLTEGYSADVEEQYLNFVAHLLLECAHKTCVRATARDTMPRYC